MSNPHQETVRLHVSPELPHVGQSRRVVGVATQQASVWDRDFRDRFIGRNSRAAAGIEPLEIEVPAEFGERLVGFMQHYMNKPRASRFYNCHRFAFWMSGVLPTGERTDLEDDPLLKNMAWHGESLAETDRLALGQHGLVVQRTRHGGTIIRHSMIGLAQPDGGPERIEVYERFGHMFVGSQAAGMNPYQSVTLQTELHVLAAATAAA